MTAPSWQERPSPQAKMEQALQAQAQVRKLQAQRQRQTSGRRAEQLQRALMFPTAKKVLLHPLQLEEQQKRQEQAQPTK